MPNHSTLATRRALGRKRVNEQMGTLGTQVPCPICDELVTCVVQGDADVDLSTPCVNACHRKSYYPWDTLTIRAADQAINARHDYERRVCDE